MRQSFRHCRKLGVLFLSKGTPPEEVAKVILKAVKAMTLDELYGRRCALQMMQARKGMSDLEFEGLVKQQFFGQ